MASQLDTATEHGDGPLAAAADVVAAGELAGELCGTLLISAVGAPCDPSCQQRKRYQNATRTPAPLLSS